VNRDTLGIRQPLCEVQFVSELLHLMLFAVRQGLLFRELVKPLLKYRYFSGKPTGFKKFTGFREYVSVPEITAVLRFMRSFGFDLCRTHSLLVCEPAYRSPRMAVQSGGVYKDGRPI